MEETKRGIEKKNEKKKIVEIVLHMLLNHRGTLVVFVIDRIYTHRHTCIRIR